jgi:hypothetical protein
MSTVTIPNLPAAGALTGTELLPVVQSGTTSNTTAQAIANLAGGGAFPYTGSAQITGSLEVIGSVENGLNNVAGGQFESYVISGYTIGVGATVIGNFTSSLTPGVKVAFINNSLVLSETTINGSNEIGGNTFITASSLGFEGINGFITNNSTITNTGVISHAQGSYTSAPGSNSHAEGIQTIASGYSSHAEGIQTIASGSNSHAEGQQTTAVGDYSHAEGKSSKAIGGYAHAEGYFTTAIGPGSHAEGNSTTAIGPGSHAEGANTTAIGIQSHAEGSFTIALANNSHAEGNATTAVGDGSHAEGIGTKAIGVQSHAEGNNTTAIGGYSHAEGQQTTAKGDYSHAEGYFTIAVGNIAHAEGNATTAVGDSSHAEGVSTTALGDYSHAEGGSTITIGVGSHAEGQQTTAVGDYSHAEGKSSKAVGTNSHAEGTGTTAAGTNSHAEGFLTKAIGGYSHTEGLGTVANQSYMQAIGQYNVTGSDQHYAYFVVGNGTADASRSNAFRVSGSGQCLAGGTFTNGGADYAEYFESFDGNAISLGTVVELTGSFIKPCTVAENAIGVISNKPSVLGNSDEGTSDEWIGKYKKDIWGNYEMVEEEYQEEVGFDEEQNPIYETKTKMVRVLNPNYDPTITYIPRAERPEWNVVGLVGQIRVLNNQPIPSRWIKMKSVNSEVDLYFVK